MKTSSFYLEDTQIFGKIKDSQITGNGEVAEFFLNKFLGCSFSENPKTVTKEFFQTSLEFFRNRIEDPLVQNTAKLHLLSYLSNNNKEINPQHFALECLEVDLRNEYKEYLSERGIANSRFKKDIEYIQTKISDMVLEFDNGIKIIGSQESFEENVI